MLLKAIHRQGFVLDIDRVLCLLHNLYFKSSNIPLMLLHQLGPSVLFHCKILIKLTRSIFSTVKTCQSLREGGASLGFDL